MGTKLLFVLISSVILVSGKPTREDPVCGYNSCPASDPDALNVHIVAHSHDDVGWLKTVDQYYYGARNGIQNAGVRYTIESVIVALLENPERRFIQVETAFFYEWWMEQDEETKTVFRGLVDNGQLEFTGGGWSMNDEAATNYMSIIDQFTFGLSILDEELGKCSRPKIGWQIDPFGHSKEMASIFSSMNYDGIFVARLDYRDKSNRLANKNMEMIWQGSSSLGDQSNIFTSAMYNEYANPRGFCFDILCDDDPIVTDPANILYNHKEKVETFSVFIKDQAQYYSTNNILITMGEDFQYQNAMANFKNMDKLIDGFTKFAQESTDGKPIKIFYSTPGCYLKAVNDAATLNLKAYTLKTDDFYPYATDPNSYWTGYYTSRPTSKRYERQSESLLRVLKQLAALDQGGPPSAAEIFELEATVGIMQHHDAITGTEKQHVADDYARIMDSAVTAATKQIDKLISNLLGQSVNTLELQNCILANISVCDQSAADKFIVAIYNSLSRSVDKHVRLPVNSESFIVTDASDTVTEVPYDVLPAISDFETQGPWTHQPFDLVFLAESVPPMGVKVYSVSKNTVPKEASINSVNKQAQFGTENLGFTIDESTGLLNSVTINGNTLSITQKLMYYQGATKDSGRPSGAYIFRPDPTVSIAQDFMDVVAFEVHSTLLVDEVHQTFSDWAKQIIRVYKNGKSNHIEFDWLVGPIDIEDRITSSKAVPKEVISRFFTPDIDSTDKFYTDSNGRQMVERKLNSRETYDYSNEEPVSGNYYPVTSRISIRDESSDVELSILNDRAQGGSSLNTGEIELMLHRRLVDDDGFGVGEALNEKAFNEGVWARGTHYLTVTGDKYAAFDSSKKLEQELAMASWVFVSDTAEVPLKTDYQGLIGDIPDNVQVLTLQPHRTIPTAYILRLEHMYAPDDLSLLAKDETVNILNLFKGITVTSFEETTLDGGQLLSDNTYLNWIVAGTSGQLEQVTSQSSKDAGDVTLKPREIKTFILYTE